MTKYNSNFNGAYPFSDTCAQLALATTTEQTYTVPGTSAVTYRAKFGYALSANVYVGLNVTAAAPAAGMSTDTENLELNPDVRYVKGGDVLSFVTPDASAQVSVSLLTLPS